MKHTQIESLERKQDIRSGLTQISSRLERLPASIERPAAASNARDQDRLFA